MPTIRERKGQWQVQVRLSGCGSLSKTFDKSADAKAWGLEQERKLKLGDTPTERRKELQGVTIKDLIDWYRQDRTIYPHKRKSSYANEDVALEAFLKREPNLCRKSVLEIRARDFSDYINRRLKADIKASTVRRELNPLRHIFRVARKERDMPIPNFFDDVELPDEEPGRDRLFTEGERRELYKATEGCRGAHQMRLWYSMIFAAEETALRRGELLKLVWGDIDFDRGLLRVRPENTKTRKGRILPMSKYLRFFLRLYYVCIPAEDRAPEKRVFPITPTAHSQAWRRITKRAELDDFHFHDLRHVAATRYDELGLTHSENQYMLGHKGRSTNDRYNHAEIERIRARLDVDTGELPKDDAELLIWAAGLSSPDDSDEPIQLTVTRKLAEETVLLKLAKEKGWETRHTD